MWPDTLFPHWQVPTTCPYPDPDQSILSPIPTSWRPILILLFHLRLGLPSVLFPTVFPPQNPVYTSPLPHTCYMPRLSHSSCFDHQHNIWWTVRSLSPTLCIFLHSPVTSPVLGPNILLSTLFSKTLSVRSSLNVSDQVSHPYKTTRNITVLYILIFIFLNSKLEHKTFCTKW